MQSLNDTLNAFRQYVEGGTRRDISQYMSYYHGKMSEFERDFYHTPINSNNSIKAVVREILTTLEIPPHQWGRYLTASLNVHDFFVELALQKQESEKLIFFIRLLDEQHILQWLKIFAGAAAALAIVEIAYPFLKNLISIQELVTAAIFMPVVGLAFTAAVALYSFYKNIRDRHIPLHQRFKDNFFLLADVALKFAAYSVLIAAATTATPLSAILFVVAECVSVLKEVVNLIQIINKGRHQPVLSSMDNLSLMQYKARQDFDYMKHRNAVLINMFTAAVCVAIVGLWCFAPPSIIVTVAAIVAIGLVYAIKAELKKCNEASLRNHLLTKFDNIERAHAMPLDAANELEDELDEAEAEDARLLPVTAAPRSGGGMRRFGMFASESGVPSPMALEAGTGLRL